MKNKRFDYCIRERYNNNIFNLGHPTIEALKTTGI